MAKKFMIVHLNSFVVDLPDDFDENKTDPMDFASKALVERMADTKNCGISIENYEIEEN